jgi:hypothetical protein
MPTDHGSCPHSPHVDASTGLAALLEAAAEAGARRALEIVGHSGSAPSELVRLHDGPIPYRIALAAVAAGELRAYGTGRRRYLSRIEVESWILAHPIARTEAVAETEPSDELDEVIEANRDRRRGRKKRGRP